jgi:HmuY protein
MFNKFLSFSFFLTAVMFLAACGDPSDPEPEALQATVVRDVPADPTTIDPLSGPRPGTGRFTFFSLRTGAVVPNTDSLTANWDLGFRGTTIIVNGGTNRRGNAGVVIRQGLFDEVNEAPETGFAQDNAPTSFAIPNTAGNGWYNYDAPRNLITPIAGRVFIIRTADGKFAKLEILSYYRGAPALLDANSVSRHYTFRYVLQPDGGLNISSKK